MKYFLLMEAQACRYLNVPVKNNYYLCVENTLNIEMIYKKITLI